MIDIQEINDTIQEFESNNLTLGNCNQLASLYIIREELEKQDLVSDTNIDENLEDLQSLLVKYMMDRDVISLNIFLNKVGEVLSELYHTCDTEKERIEFKEFIESVESILTPTIC